MTSKFCPNCGTEITGEFKFCPSCGSRLPEIIAAPSPEPSPRKSAGSSVVCPTCGFQNSSSARACESCGTFLGGTGVEESDVAGKARPQEEESKRRVIEKSQSKSRSEKKNAAQKSEEKKGAQGKKFHIESFQVVAIVAALLLGGILVYGLLTSRSSSTADSAGGNMPSQQQASGSAQPSPDVLHEIDRLREIVNKQPDDLGSLLQLSNILQDNRFYDQAAIYYKRYLDKVPKNVDARVDYGVTLFESGHTQDAIDQIKEGLKINPKHQIGLFNLGIVYLNAGEFDKANQAFEECVKVDPNSDIGKKAKQTLEQHANITSQEVK